jgi:hypothetical protein
VCVEAVSLLDAGTTIEVFSSLAITTAPHPFCEAVDLPSKMFTARMITSARARVLSVCFELQCRPLLQRSIRYSLTPRQSLSTQITAWKIRTKLAEAMRVAGDAEKLSGRIEMDDAYLGGERGGGKRGRGSPGKKRI